MVSDLVPRLEAYFADQADRVAQRLRRLAEGQAALMVNIHVQTKAEFPFGADDLMPGSEDAGLRVVLNPHVLAAAESGWEAAADEFAIDAAFDVENPHVGRVLSSASSERVRRINDVTRETLRRTLDAGADRGYSVYQMANGVTADDFPGIRSVVEETYRGRAETIARTEMAWGSNQGATALYASEGVTHVEVLDGMDWDEPCQAANGQTWTLERAEAEPLQHPNCQRAFAPVVGKPEDAVEGGQPPAGGRKPPRAEPEYYDPNTMNAAGVDKWGEGNLTSPFGRSRGAFSADELEALREYKSSGYLDINDLLRGKSFRGPKAPVKKSIKNIDTAIDNHQVGQDIVVRRAINKAPKELLDQFGDDLVGTTFQDNAFLSTTLRKDVASKWVRTEGDIMLNMKVKADTPGLWMESGKGVLRESELLLGRDVKWTVVKAYAKDGKKNLDLVMA